MKKMKRDNIMPYILLGIFILLGLFIFGLNKLQITIFATNPVTFNISVGGPEVRIVYNNSMTDVSNGLQAGPLPTTILINFSVFSTSGAGNLNLSSALVNFSKSGESLRSNTTCKNTASAGSYANFSCNVTMMWFDGAGSWDITAYIWDNQSNAGRNTTTKLQVGSTTGFDMGPTALTFPGLSPGSTNITSNNDPILLNNTGNVNIGITQGTNISINATNLRGETNNLLALWARNFSVYWTTGAGPPPTECGTAATGRTVMVNGAFTNITGVNLTAGNYSQNNNVTGQEQIFLCLLYAGAELTTQSYSTSNESSWTVQIA